MKKIIVFTVLLGISMNSFSQETGKFNDLRDGKVYKTVKIGTQTWFAENLAFKPSIGNYWSYNNDNENVKNYGYLYDWETAKSVCPKGWHLPSQAEWKSLIEFLGGETSAGGKMKATQIWKTPNTGATNSSGFNAIPAGDRDRYGTFELIGDETTFWASTANDETASWYCTLEYSSSNALLIYTRNTIGYSVRCIKD